jgi:hypothetical protein
VHLLYARFGFFNWLFRRLVRRGLRDSHGWSAEGRANKGDNRQ